MDFEKDLVSKIRGSIGDNANIKIRENEPARSHRRYDIKTNNNEFLSDAEKYVRNSSSVAVNKGNYERINTNVSLPDIKPKGPTSRNQGEKF